MVKGHTYSAERGQQPTVVNIYNTGAGGTQSSTTSGGGTVERNRNAMIQVFGSDIKQDFKVIGTFSHKSERVDGQSVNVYSFFLPNGTKVAEGTVPTFGDKTCSLWTISDNRRQSLTLKSIGTSAIAKEIAEVLVRGHYL